MSAELGGMGRDSALPAIFWALVNPCARGDNHSSVELGDHELIFFQCHLDTLL